MQTTTQATKMYGTIQKTIIAWVFNHYIAYYYFDNVNVSQLKVAFENGEIELENLPIKKDALYHLKLPLNVVSGVVGRLSIKIPLLSLLTDPWEIKLSNLMLIISPRKRTDDCAGDNTNDQSHLDSIRENVDPSLVECIDNSISESENRNIISSEETKLAEFYSSFSATVSSIVKDIYKNIRLEIKNLTLLFEDFDLGLVKFSSDSVLLHRPEANRKLTLQNTSIYLSNLGSHTCAKRDDLLQFHLDSCNLELCDVPNQSNQTSLEINSETEIRGNIFMTSSLGTTSIPICEYLLEDCRILYFSGDQQQDGSMFARLSCCHFNRETSSWDSFLSPWPFNLTWDRRSQQYKMSLTSDESADFSVSSELLDLIDVVLRRTSTNNTQSKLWPVLSSPSSSSLKENGLLDFCASLRQEERSSDDSDAKLLRAPIYEMTFVPPVRKNFELTSTPKRGHRSSPRDCKLIYYNYNTNLAHHIGARSIRRLFSDIETGQMSELDFIAPGVKFTLYDNHREKIIEISIENIKIKSSTRAKDQILDCSIQDISIVNALPDCEKSIVLDRAFDLNDSFNTGPAIKLIMDRIVGKSFGTVWFRQVQLSLCELMLNIEEKLFLKLVEFVSFRRQRGSGIRDSLKLSRDLNKILHPEETRGSKYYFDLLRIDLSSLKLSVSTSTDLPSSLQKLKSSLKLNFIGFEEARLQLSPYLQMNVSQTLKGVFDSVTRFYKRQISEQAPRIVGQQIQYYLRFRLSDLLSSLYDEVYRLFY